MPSTATTKSLAASNSGHKLATIKHPYITDRQTFNSLFASMHRKSHFCSPLGSNNFRATTGTACLARTLLASALLLSFIFTSAQPASAQQPQNEEEEQEQDLIAIGGTYLEAHKTLEDTGPGTSPAVAFNGRELAFFKDQTLVGWDFTGKTFAWQSEPVNSVRQHWQHGTVIYLASEHLRALNINDGKTLWTYPLNCNQDLCASDVVSMSQEEALIAGFAPKFNMLMLLDLASGRPAWPSWAVTCPIRKASATKERIFVLCEPATTGTTKEIAQILDIRTRRLVCSIAAPEEGFDPLQGWYGENHSYILGKVGDATKLAVFDSKTGTPAKKYSVKGDNPSEQGYFLATASDLFVPWQSKDDAISLWGMQANTGTIVWNRKIDRSTIVDQWDDTLLLRQQYRSGFRLVGISLASGKTAYQIPLPFKLPRFVKADQTLLVYAAGERLFMAIHGPTGAILALTQLATPVEYSHAGQIHFSCTQTHAALRIGESAFLFLRREFATWLEQVSSALDSGNEIATAQLLDPLVPFAQVSKAVNDARRQYSLFLLLNAELKLRRNEADPAIADGRKATDWAAQFTPEDLKSIAPALLRFWTQCAWNCPRSPERAEFFLTALVLLHSKPDLWGAAENVANVASLMAHALKDSEFESDAADIIAELHALPTLTKPLEEHPGWLAKQLQELSAALDGARSQLSVGDYYHAAKMLHPLSKNPAALMAFKNDTETWHDAISAYLLPVDLMEEKIPPLVARLEKLFKKGQRRLDKETETLVCVANCRTTGANCSAECVDANQCADAVEKCVKSCGRGKPAWTPPQFTTSTLSPTFFRCR